MIPFFPQAPARCRRSLPYPATRTIVVLTLVIAVTLAAEAGYAQSAHATGASRPNIVLIMADDK